MNRCVSFVAGSLLAVAAFSSDISAKHLSMQDAQIMAKAVAQKMVSRQADVPANEFALDMVFEGGIPDGVSSALQMQANFTGGWDTLSQEIYTRNANGEIAEILYKELNTSGTWDTIQKMVVEYEGALLTTATLQIWESTGQVWSDMAKYTFTYSNDSLKTIEISFRFEALGTWTQYISGTFYYSAFNGQLDSLIMVSTMPDPDEPAEAKIELIYAESGDISERHGYGRISSADPWVEKARSTMTYPAGFEISVDEEWDTAADAWVLTDSVVTALGTDDNLITETIFKWNDTTSAWIANSRDTCAYTGTIIAEKISQVWNATDAQWDDASKTVYSADNIGIIAGTQAVPRDALVTVSIDRKPDGAYLFTVRTAVDTRLSMDIFAMNGTRISSPVSNQTICGAQQFSVNMNNRAGSYICRIKSSAGMYTQAFSVAR